METNTGNNTKWMSIGEFYHFVFTELADPRTSSYVLIADPLPGLGILAFYIYFVNSLGPRFMKNREPFNLQRTIYVYNTLQASLSFFMFVEILSAMWWNRYSFRCEPVDYSTSPHALRVARMVYIFFIAKMTELIETVFFVLRKKQKQVTFLHCYHHAVMPMVTWGATKYFAGGHGTFIGLINSFVHIIMYLYYLQAGMGYRNLWWKKYITMMQLGQFLLFFVHFAQLWFIECDFPKWTALLITPQVLFFIYLFSKFYMKSYKKNDEKDNLPGYQTEGIRENGESIRKRNVALTQRSNVFDGQIGDRKVIKNG
ncbi:unnamed protein product [Acanthoscelides obtectus]|uniref:Elongation of very long chain fatty acids protein n=1 Tax=Acanthoscelides obtectus TaxID=200917 RepID=A0A9P0PBM9_ACAOB|nr:unnamed protein product [Acanthoscelides obtectus]CAK1621088.1 Elongation of very long chain fatty acids protein 7 [Acanthoscelides obtectus]